MFKFIGAFTRNSQINFNLMFEKKFAEEFLVQASTHYEKLSLGILIAPKFKIH